MNRAPEMPSDESSTDAISLSLPGLPRTHEELGQFLRVVQTANGFFEKRQELKMIPIDGVQGGVRYDALQIIEHTLEQVLTKAEPKSPLPAHRAQLAAEIARMMDIRLEEEAAA